MVFDGSRSSIVASLITRALLALLAVALLATGTSACGAAREAPASSPPGHSGADAAIATTVSGSAHTGVYLRGDGDADGSGSPEDDDDSTVRDFGHPASTGDAKAVTALLERYYAAAAAGGGATGCSLMSPRLANESNLGEAAELAYPPAFSTPLLHGKPCARILSVLFKEDHAQLAADSATVVVTGVRVDGRHGLALLGFRTTPERQVPVEREGRAWKVGALLAQEIR
jgi:hypothetical protein